MKDNNVVVEKSYAFAVRIINCYKYMTTDKKEFVLSKQLLRFLNDTGFLEKKITESLLSDCDELLKIIGSITKSLKQENS